MPITSTTHYDVLSLPRKPDLSAAEIKHAYHQTLLTHHPDKIRQVSSGSRVQAQSNSTATTPVPSIDDIVSAYATLSDPATRASYEADLKRDPTLSRNNLHASAHAGLESFDLEELDYKEDPETGKGRWMRQCRCGNDPGYVVTEAELEEVYSLDEKGHSADMKQILVGCQGCSLLIRLTFAVEA